MHGLKGLPERNRAGAGYRWGGRRRGRYRPGKNGWKRAACGVDQGFPDGLHVV